MTMVSAAGWRVEKVIRTLPGRGPTAKLRVSWKGYWQADCDTTDEVAKYVDLSTLVPAVPHLYERAYRVSPWQLASELLEAEMARAQRVADEARCTVPMPEHAGRAHLHVVPDQLPVPTAD